MTVSSKGYNYFFICFVSQNECLLTINGNINDRTDNTNDNVQLTDLPDECIYLIMTCLTDHADIVRTGKT